MTVMEMEAFLAIYRTGSVSKAAEGVGISQSSLSIRLKKLEEELGCRLFERGKGIKETEATEAGKRMYPLAVDYVELNKRIQSLAAPQEDLPLRVSVNNSLAACMLSPVFKRYLTEDGGRQLEIMDMVSQNALPALTGGILDMALATDPCKSRELLIHPVISERMMLAVSGELIQTLQVEKGVEFVDYEQLLPEQEVYVSWNEDVDSWHRMIFGDSTRPGITVSVTDQLRFFLEAKSCWAIVPYTVAVKLAESPAIEICPIGSLHPGQEVPRRITYANYPKRYRNDLRIEAFFRFLQDFAGNFDPADLRWV